MAISRLRRRSGNSGDRKNVVYAGDSPNINDIFPAWGSRAQAGAAADSHAALLMRGGKQLTLQEDDVYIRLEIYEINRII